MNSIFFRVDDRLIHGQVIEGWVKFLNATKIVVIDDKVTNDALQKLAMEIAVPSNIKVLITTVADSIGEIDSCLKKNEKTLALFSNLGDVVRAVILGLKIDSLNLGGLRFAKGKRLISETIFLDQEDAEILKKLLNLGIKINIQSTPSESFKNIQQILMEKF